MHPFCLVTERVEVLPYALCILLYLAKLCRDVPAERLYDKKEQGGLYKRIWYHT
jgi:hypothetical protein